jgi:hypothetical protein
MDRAGTFKQEEISGHEPQDHQDAQDRLTACQSQSSQSSQCYFDLIGPCTDRTDVTAIL